MRKYRFFTLTVSRIYKTALAIGAFVIIILSCEKKEVTPPRVFPRVLTGQVTEISEDGAVVHGEIALKGSEPIIERGFVWHEADRVPTLSNADFKPLTPDPENPLFSYKIRSTIVNGEKYRVRAYAKTASYTVYGNMVTFAGKGSHGPEMTDFEPKKGWHGDTVRIYGRYFSNKIMRNEVKFGDRDAQLTSWSDSLLVAVVPRGISSEKVKITVTVTGKTTTIDDYFQKIGMEIEDFNPKLGAPGDTVIITGKLFSNVNYENEVKFNNYTAPVITSDTNLIVTLVPLALRDAKSIISIKNDNYRVTASDTFRLLIPEIKDVVPQSARIGDTLLIKGKYFNPIRDENEVMIDNVRCSLIEASDSIIKLIVPKHSYDNVDLTRPKMPSDLYVKSRGLVSSHSNLFTYIIPYIKSLTPSMVSPGDTMQIIGNNFSPFKKELIIRFGDLYNGIKSEIIKITDNEISFIVPEGTTSSVIWFITDDYETALKDGVSFFPPQIQSISPKTVFFNDIITIRGNYLQNTFRVYIQYKKAYIISAEKKVLKVKLPYNVQSTDGKLSLILEDGYAYRQIYNDALNLPKPELYSFSPDIIYNSTKQITISGKWFNPVANQNNVVINGMKMPVIQANSTELTAEVEMTPPYLSTKFKDVLTVKRNGQSVSSSDSITVDYNSLWTRINDFPGALRQGATYFSLGNKGYIVGGSLSNYLADAPTLTEEVWEFSDMNGGEWVQKKSFPGELRGLMIAFTDGNFAYVGMGNGYNDIWRYDPVSDSWSHVTDFPGKPRRYPMVFVLNHKAYIGLGTLGNAQSENLHDVWEYDIPTDTWTQKDSIDYFKDHGNIKAIGATLNGKGYVSVFSTVPLSENSYTFSRRILEYDQNNDTWIHLTNTNPGVWGIHTVMNDKWYRFDAKLYSFDPLTNNWVTMPNYSGIRNFGIAFVINEKIYFGLGPDYYSPRQPIVRKMWMIDPSKYP